METIKNIFLSIYNSIKAIITYIFTHTFTQILLVIIFLHFFKSQLFEHSKFGVFVNCTDNVVHDNRKEDVKK